MSPFPSLTELEHSRHELRRELLARRNAMPTAEARKAALEAARQLAASPGFRSAVRVAGYVALEHELDPAPVVQAALNAGKAVYLPRVLDSVHMEFVRWRAGEPLHANRFGIPEPAADPDRVLAPEDLDLALVPLLGFDGRGNRLGFGAGFYDRAFAFRRVDRAPPLLCGCAYAWQETGPLAAADWDVPLDAVVTEHGLRHFDRGERPPD